MGSSTKGGFVRGQPRLTLGSSKNLSCAPVMPCADGETSPLFSEEELQALRDFLQLGASRDVALTFLVGHGWRLASAASAWAEDPVSGQAHHGPPVATLAEERPADLCRHCTRSRACRKPVCCDHCPGRHTRTCEERRRRDRGPIAATAPPVTLGAHNVGGSEPEPEAEELEPAAGRETEPFGDVSSYVVVRAPQRSRAWLGLHQLPWAELEFRLGVGPGALAGRLAEHGVGLRRAATLEQAEHFWRRAGHQGQLPRHPRIM